MRQPGPNCRRNRPLPRQIDGNSHAGSPFARRLWVRVGRRGCPAWQFGGVDVSKVPLGVGPKHAQVVVLVGATGDLSRRKLLPGLFHLASRGFIPGCRVIGVSLDNLDADGFRAFAREALNQFSTRKLIM
jgi:hypothetical protein